MSKITFIRICGLSAILGGALRATAAFVPETYTGIYLLYFTIDLFLLLGITGLFRVSVTGWKVLRYVSFAILFGALLVLIARDIGIVPKSAYAGGAALFSLGLDLVSIQTLRSRKMPSWIPLAWIISTVLGPIGFFVLSLRFLFAISGLLFGIAFASAGVVVWKLSSTNDISLAGSL